MRRTSGENRSTSYGCSYNQFTPLHRTLSLDQQEFFVAYTQTTTGKNRERHRLADTQAAASTPSVEAARLKEPPYGRRQPVFDQQKETDNSFADCWRQLEFVHWNRYPMHLTTSLTASRSTMLVCRGTFSSLMTPMRENRPYLYRRHRHQLMLIYTIKQAIVFVEDMTVRLTVETLLTPPSHKPTITTITSLRSKPPPIDRMPWEDIVTDIEFLPV
jgi:hypothetical protein